MPTNRPNEDRYASQPEFLENAKREALQKHNREKNKDHLGGKKTVIEKLTAPPETFLEHAERIGLNVNVNDIMTGDGRLLRRHYSINFSEQELKEAEDR